MIKEYNYEFEGEEVIVYSEADIDNVIMYGDKEGIISYQKENIQKDIREIKNIL